MNDRNTGHFKSGVFNLTADSSLTNQKGSSYRLLWILGAAMTLPMILFSGPLAGYALGFYIGVKVCHWPGWVVPIFIGLGFLGSGLQVFRLIKRIKELDSTGK